MAKKKRKRVYKIMRLTDSCNQKVKDGLSDINLEYDTTDWDAECIADYYFMEYYPDDSDDEYQMYYRQNVCMTVWNHTRSRRMRVNGKYVTEQFVEEVYIISKRTKYGQYIEVFRTTDMDELSEVLQSFGEFDSIAWWTEYDAFISAFRSLYGMDE